MRLRQSQSGLSLFEALLVLAILSLVITLAVNYTTQKMAQLRRDKATMQIQQILNAALSYYVTNGQWPLSSQTVACPGDTIGANGGTQKLQATGYLPTKFPSPWAGQIYQVCATNNGANFTVQITATGGTTLAANQDAAVVAGMVPNGSSTNATLTANVNIPGQNLNNARSVNFTGVYNNGACVPVPTCPGTMQPSIIVSPYVVNGYTQAPNCGTPAGSNCLHGSGNCDYQDDVINAQHCTPATAPEPVTSFTAYVQGGIGGATTPKNCYNAPTTTTCKSLNVTAPANQTYWRVCLDVGVQTISSTTGEPATVYLSTLLMNAVNSGNPTIDIVSVWGAMIGSINVLTRCVPSTSATDPTQVKEFEGTTFGVWSQ